MRDPPRLQDVDEERDRMAPGRLSPGGAPLRYGHNLPYSATCTVARVQD